MTTPTTRALASCFTAACRALIAGDMTVSESETLPCHLHTLLDGSFAESYLRCPSRNSEDTLKEEALGCSHGLNVGRRRGESEASSGVWGLVWETTRTLT